MSASPRSAELAEWMNAMARERGLAALPAPRWNELAATELLAEAMRVVERDTPRAAMRAHVLVLSTLELVPPDFDWLASVAASLSGSLRAFYDPQRRVIFSDRALARSERQSAVVHELTHVLQQEHPALASERALESDDWDAASARQSIWEGDAEAFTAWLVHGAAAPEREAEAPAAAVPSIVRRALAAPYVDGRTAVEAARARGGWASVNALVRSPPRSTHELLHPGAPRGVRRAFELGAPPGGEWSLAARGVMGEQALRCILEEWIATAVAERVASAWSDDRLAWFQAGAASALSWRIDLDGSAGARDLFGVIGTALALHERSSGDPRVAAPACRAKRGGGIVALASQAEHLWVFGVHGLSTEASCRLVATWLAQLQAQ